MTVPLVRYLQLTAQSRWMRLGLLVLLVCFLVAVLGTYSRGAMVGLAVTAIALLVKSRHRMRLALVAGLALAAAVQFMPEHWHARSPRFRHYEEDASAQARIASWRYGLEVVREHPVVGGGLRSVPGQPGRDLGRLPQRPQHLLRNVGRTRLGGNLGSSLSSVSARTGPHGR